MGHDSIMNALSPCHADDDDMCDWKDCPQLRDGEPKKTGRHCPIDAAFRDQADQ